MNSRTEAIQSLALQVVSILSRLGNVETSTRQCPCGFMGRIDSGDTTSLLTLPDLPLPFQLFSAPATRATPFST